MKNLFACLAAASILLTACGQRESSEEATSTAEAVDTAGAGIRPEGAGPGSGLTEGGETIYATGSDVTSIPAEGAATSTATETQSAT